MSAKTSIEWCDRTWNPTRGCSLVSAGCTNCYAMRVARRFDKPGLAYEGLTVMRPGLGPVWNGKIKLVEEALLEPLRWRKPCRVFVNSMSDLFHEGVPDSFIDRVCAVIGLCPRHQFLVLTKREKRMREYMIAPGRELFVRHAMDTFRPNALRKISGWPLPNLWLGVSVENQAAAEQRIPALLDTPAAVRFVSVEPLLGAVDLRQIRINAEPHCRGHCALTGVSTDTPWAYAKQGIGGPFSRGKLDWVIVGGESGPGARPMDLAWARSIVAQCKAAGVPVFMKQLGARPVLSEPRDWVLMPHRQEAPANILQRVATLRDRKKGGDPSEWPEDLRVREYPRA